MRRQYLRWDDRRHVIAQDHRLRHDTH